MSRVRLIYKGMAEVVGNDSMAIAMLTDTEEERAISVICDGAMKYQLWLRDHPERCCSLLPEVLLKMMSSQIDMDACEINISGIAAGEYRTTIMNMETLDIQQIRLSDAVLLARISGMPIYIDADLMRRQSFPYKENIGRMAIPINTLSTKRLHEVLDKAVEDEDYRLAAFVKEELDKRD